MKHTLDLSSSIEYQSGNPVDCYAGWSEHRSGEDRLLLVDFELEAHWLKDAPSIPLTAIYLESDQESSVSVTDGALVSSDLSVVDQYIQWTDDYKMVRYSPGSPIKLQPLDIPKPWGREIWFTGLEERGVCSFSQGGLATPIPWLQAVTSGESLGEVSRALVLLKILDPVAEPVVGDLYFELHEEKQEVYVVTHVDKRCWPEGVGYIRMGFDPEIVDSFGGDIKAFKQAYLRVVEDYETIRREIDCRSPGSAIPPELEDRECELRSQVDSFSLLKPLVVGDVVKVPLLTPHSLQHGVRTVEFQTPVYERKILSFAQQVLTQNHWDTKEAVDIMVLEPPPEDDFALLEDGPGILVERIVNFSDFEVHRIILSKGASMTVPALKSYALVMVVEGVLALGSSEFGPENALILPVGWSGDLTLAQPEFAGVLLLAIPRY
ncbi:MAG: hypothetical protein AB8B81_10425 [Halioglobus sp.]